METKIYTVASKVVNGVRVSCQYLSTRTPWSEFEDCTNLSQANLWIARMRKETGLRLTSRIRFNKTEGVYNVTVEEKDFPYSF